MLHVGLTENINLEEFQRVCDAPTNQSAMPITILTGLLCSKDDVISLNFIFLTLSICLELKIQLFIANFYKYA